MGDGATMARRATGAAKREAVVEVVRDDKFNARRIELAEAALETLGELGFARTNQHKNTQNTTNKPKTTQNSNSLSYTIFAHASAAILLLKSTTSSPVTLR